MRQGFLYGGLTDVTCHGHTMTRDEKCFTIHRRTGPVTHDHPEEAASQTRQNWFLLGIGAPLALGGAFWFTSAAKSRRHPPATPQR